MTGLYQRFLLLLASVTDRELAHVQYLKQENRIPRSKLPGRISVTPQEWEGLVRFGLAVGTANKQLITIVSPRTFLRWVHGDSPRPKRGEGTWSEFLARHGQTLWVCDFLSTKVWTTARLVEMYVFVSLHLGSRRIVITALTANPGAAWMVQQARNFCLQADDVGHKPRHLLRDHDSKFTAGFDEVLRDDGLTVKPVGPLAPNLNAQVERVIQTVKHECLDHFVVLGEAHLRHLLSAPSGRRERAAVRGAVGRHPAVGAHSHVRRSARRLVEALPLGGLTRSACSPEAHGPDRVSSAVCFERVSRPRIWARLHRSFSNRRSSPASSYLHRAATFAGFHDHWTSTALGSTCGGHNS